MKAKGRNKKEANLEIEDVARQLTEHVVPARPRLVVDDVTPERLAALMAEQGGRIALLSAEGSGPFELMAGRYAKNDKPNLGVYLSGHCAEPLRVDRVHREDVFVERPALTIGLAVQPDVIRALADKPGFRSVGLLARFLYAVPRSTVGRRKSNPPAVPEEVMRQYHSLVAALLTIGAAKPSCGGRKEHLLTLNVAARGVLFSFMDRLEPNLADGGALCSIGDWAGKLTGAVVRLSAIIHMVRHVGSNTQWESTVEPDSVHRAIQLGEYLIPHARAAFAQMGSHHNVELAKHVLAWTRREVRSSFSKRDAFNALRGRVRKVDEIVPALDELAERGFIRLRALPERCGPGRRPSPIYDVNPHAHNTHNTHNGVTGGYSARSAHSADQSRI